jgi:polygalacturonase
MKRNKVLFYVIAAVIVVVIVKLWFPDLSNNSMPTRAGDHVQEAMAHIQDSSDIQQAIDAAAASGGGDVEIPAGKYDVKNTIIVKPSVTLQLNSGTMLVPVKDVNVIELRSNSAVNGGIIYAYEFKGYSKSGIYLDGAQKFSGTLKSASISNIKIIGRPGYGNGLFFYAEEESDHVSWVEAHNLNITGFEKAIYFKTEPVHKPDKIWINGNNFSQIFIKDTSYGIYLDGHMDLPYEISGNNFTGVQIQTSELTKQAIFVKGTKNYIQAMIWDYHLGAEAIHLDKDSLRNQIQSNVSIDDQAYIDYGIDNLSVSAK